MKTKERPILFNGPMVRAILAGKKTQTRRPLKPQLELIGGLWQAFYPWGGGGHGIWETETEAIADYVPTMVAHCPHGRPGDLLWVRETLRRDPATDEWNYAECVAPVELDADDPNAGAMIAWAHHKKGDVCTSIHMPRWAARIFLRVTDVRVQRVQDITEEEAIAEGTQEPSVTKLIGGGDVTERRVFARLWSSVYGASSWERNEWVWALTFERVDLPR